jgi:hypothetical protein
MKGVELYGRVRYAVRIEGLSERAAARRSGLDPRTAMGSGFGPYQPSISRIQVKALELEIYCAFICGVDHRQHT